MKLHVAITRGGSTEHVTVGPMAIIAWEKDTGQKISGLASTGIGLSDLADLSWRQLKLQGKAPEKFDDFLAELEDLDPEEAPDPM